MPGFMQDLDFGAGSLLGPEATLEIPGPGLPLEAKDGVWGVYADKPTSELLSIYEQQQEELVKLSKELEEFTKKNIELSTSNLQQLQQLHSTNSPVVSNIAMQPPRLSQLSLQVRQRLQQDSASAIGLGNFPHHAGAAGNMVQGGSFDGRPREHRGDGHMLHVNAQRDAEDDSAPHGICTQEDAAAILLQMSRRIDDPL
jgi:hypothetical protein